MISFAGFAIGVLIGIPTGALGMVIYLGYKVMIRK